MFVRKSPSQFPSAPLRSPLSDARFPLFVGVYRGSLGEMPEVKLVGVLRFSPSVGRKMLHRFFFNLSLGGIVDVPKQAAERLLF